MITSNKKLKKIISIIFYVISILALLLWFGVFNSENIIEKRIAVLFVVTAYITIPIILKRHKNWNLLLEDKRNIYLLAISGLFAIFAVHGTVEKGLLTSEFILTTSLAICVFIYTLFLVKSQSEKYSKLE